MNSSTFGNSTTSGNPTCNTASSGSSISSSGKEIPPVINAIYRKDHVALRDALNKGENPNSQDNSGNAAVVVTIYHKDPIALRILLEGGADPNGEDQSGNTALAIAGYHKADISAGLLKADPAAVVRHSARVTSVSRVSSVVASLTP